MIIPMNRNTPKVSIGLPVYNGENYLREALDSLLSQTYTDFELIISDNASTDATQSICEDYASKDMRIHYHRCAANIGAAANYNRVFELARGEYFKWAAHDDVCSPEFLMSCVEQLDGDSESVLCYPTDVAIDSKGEIIPNYMDKYTNLNHLEMPTPYKRLHDLACLRHGCFQVFGLMRSESLRNTPKIANFIGADRVLLAELALKGGFWKSSHPIYFRRHEEQYCALSNKDSRESWYSPESNKKITFTMKTQLIEHFRLIHRVNLAWFDRVLCYLVMMDWMRRKRRRLAQELYRSLSF